MKATSVKTASKIAAILIVTDKNWQITQKLKTFYVSICIINSFIYILSKHQNNSQVHRSTLKATSANMAFKMVVIYTILIEQPSSSVVRASAYQFRCLVFDSSLRHCLLMQLLLTIIKSIRLGIVGTARFLSQKKD